eukprot:COSAG04_NODE_4628_length_1985_cov_1.364263_1_plen_428_part_10
MPSSHFEENKVTEEDFARGVAQAASGVGDATAATEFTKLHQLWAASQGTAGDTIGDVDLRQMAASRFVAYRETWHEHSSPSPSRRSGPVAIEQLQPAAQREQRDQPTATVHRSVRGAVERMIKSLERDEKKAAKERAKAARRPPEPSAPHGWGTKWSPDHKQWFFYNLATNESTWTRPPQPSTSDDSDATSPLSSPDSAGEARPAAPKTAAKVHKSISSAVERMVKRLEKEAKKAAKKAAKAEEKRQREAAKQSKKSKKSKQKAVPKLRLVHGVDETDSDDDLPLNKRKDVPAQQKRKSTPRLRLVHGVEETDSDDDMPLERRKDMPETCPLQQAAGKGKRLVPGAVSKAVERMVVQLEQEEKRAIREEERRKRQDKTMERQCRAAIMGIIKQIVLSEPEAHSVGDRWSMNLFRQQNKKAIAAASGTR